jgi:hypothetical protein
MKYVMVHKEGGATRLDDEPFLAERIFAYDTEEARDAQVQHDLEFFPDKEIFVGTQEGDEEIELKKAKRKKS